MSVRLNTAQANVLAVSAPRAQAPPIRLVVYPNPGKNKVKLENATANSAVLLLDATGRAIRAYPSAALPLDISALPAGLYLLRCAEQTARLLVE